MCYHIIEHDFDEIIHQMKRVASTSQSKEEIMKQSLDVFLKFKFENSDLLNCIEESNTKTQFHHSQFSLTYSISIMIYFMTVMMKDGLHSKRICY